MHSPHSEGEKLKTQLLGSEQQIPSGFSSLYVEISFAIDSTGMVGMGSMHQVHKLSS